LFNDRVLFSPLSDCPTNLKRCTTEGKILLTFAGDVSTFKQVIAIIGRLLSLTQLAADFRFIVITSLSFADTKFSRFVDCCELIDARSQPSLKRLISVNVTSVPFHAFDMRGDCPPARFRRFAMLLAFFDAAVHCIAETVFQVRIFSTSHYPIALEFARSFASSITGDAQIIKEFVIDQCCVASDPCFSAYFEKLWNSIFVPANFEPRSVKILNKYEIAFSFGSDSIARQFDHYPCLDDLEFLNLPQSSGSLWKAACVRQWRGEGGSLFVTESRVSTEERSRISTEEQYGLLLANQALSSRWSLSSSGFVISTNGKVDIGRIWLVNGTVNPRDGRIEGSTHAPKVEEAEIGIGPVTQEMLQVPLIHAGSVVGTLFANPSGENVGVVFAQITD
jgi:hypothetical protein